MDSPTLRLLVKLGSIAVHVDEFLDSRPDAARGHGHDKIVLRGLLEDPEVVGWLQAMRKDGLLPVKR